MSLFGRLSVPPAMAVIDLSLSFARTVMLRLFASRTLRAPPVSETVPWKSLPARARVTSAVPALMIVAPATKASAVCVTASLLVVTFRLAAALPTPLAPMAPSCVATLLTIVTAPVPVELMAPASWLPALLSVTAALPAATVVGAGDERRGGLGDRVIARADAQAGRRVADAGGADRAELRGDAVCHGHGTGAGRADRAGHSSAGASS